MYAGISVALILAGLILYFSQLRPRQLRWGATDEELDRQMPGDEIVERPTFNATRGVTIEARPDQIFPWIAQMGLTRAGWYSYDLLDNLGRRSAETILPQFQEVHVGGLVPMSPDGKQGMRVLSVAKNQSLLWGDEKGDTSWAWAIYPQGETASRLITRVRVKYRWFSPALAFNLLIEVFDGVMMRKSMLGIKRRAERAA